MKQKNRILIMTLITTLVIFTLVACSSTPVEPSWLYDYGEALQVAQEHNKNILVFATGSDWDEKSQTLLNETFPSKDFASKIAPHYVLVQLDYPDNYETMSEEQVYKNMDVANYFGFQSIPTVVLTTKDAYIIKNYNEFNTSGQVEDYIKQIQKIKRQADDVISTNEKLTSAEGVKKAKLADKLLQKLDPDYIDRHIGLIAEILKSDPENTTKLHDKYPLPIALLKADGLLSEGDFPGAIQTILDTATDEKLSKEESQQAYWYTAVLNTQFGGDGEKTLDYLQLAYDAAPESEMAADITYTMSMLRLEMEEAENATTEDNGQ